MNDWLDDILDKLWKDAWCKSCNGKHFIRCSFGKGNPYTKFEEARFSIMIPLIATGIPSPNQPTKANKEIDNE